MARALAGRPRSMFADEPTGNLDSRTGAEILAFMRQAVRRAGPDDRDGHPRPGGRRRTPTGSSSSPTARIVDEMHDPTARPRAGPHEELRGLIADVAASLVKGLLAHKLRFSLTGTRGRSSASPSWPGRSCSPTRWARPSTTCSPTSTEAPTRSSAVTTVIESDFGDVQRAASPPRSSTTSRAPRASTRPKARSQGFAQLVEAGRQGARAPDRLATIGSSWGEVARAQPVDASWTDERRSGRERDRHRPGQRQRWRLRPSANRSKVSPRARRRR